MAPGPSPDMMAYTRDEVPPEVQKILGQRRLDAEHNYKNHKYKNHKYEYARIICGKEPYKHRDITDGPSNEKLFDALRLQKENRELQFTVCFNTSFGSRRVHNLIFTVAGAIAENDSGTEWTLFLYDQLEHFDQKNLVGSYNTVSRKGWVRPFDL
ncbi:hypothetical protein L0Y46_01210 [bacterium]|nr:hypothetical protein [bacterium]MCI0680319.1 hypothetical protein [bacterium]